MRPRKNYGRRPHSRNRGRSGDGQSSGTEVIKTISVKAKSTELALKKAAAELGCVPEDVSYELISQTSAGIFSFLGFGSVEIKAWHGKSSQHSEPKDVRDRYSSPSRSQNRRSDQQPKSERQERPDRSEKSERSERPTRTERTERTERPERQERAERNGARSAPRRDPRTIPDNFQLDPVVQAKVETITKDLCQRMVHSPVSVFVSRVEDKLTIKITNSDIAEMLPENPKLLEAFEHLIRKMYKDLGADFPLRFFVDCNDYREKREKELIDVAKDICNQVIENQKPIVLNYRSAYDRKIIHMTLEAESRVYTKSIGSGNHRKLMVLPSDGQKSSADL